MLEDALRAALDNMMWESDGFAVADSYDATSGRYAGLATSPSGAIAGLTDLVLVVHPTVASAQLERERREKDAKDRTGRDGEYGPEQLKRPEETDDTEEIDDGKDRRIQPSPDTRFFGAVQVNPQRYARDFTKIGEEILQHLAAV